ncbi:MAG: hypothetical protein PHV34_07285 [Verrucomicrobiae bacterium]|nr:hypothetical protein [Verrucomicrobiae bacterium]
MKTEWIKGVAHYHTGFRYPGETRLSPQKMAQDLKRLGAKFAFCAGDHGDQDGNYYWGLDVREFGEFREFCLTESARHDFLFIPAPEIHLMFPPFSERHEHHSCVPLAGFEPSLEPPETRALAASFTRDVEGLMAEARRQGIALTLNHPWLSVHSAFGGPPPLEVPGLEAMDCFELFTIDHPDKFPLDFGMYLSFLRRERSGGMGCCASVDNAVNPNAAVSDETRIVPATYLGVNGELTVDSVMEAWNDRRSCAVYGDFRIERLEPVPSRALVKAKIPFLRLAAANLGGKKIGRVEIFRNGEKVFEDQGKGSERYSLDWEDRKTDRKTNRYVLHVEAEGEHLIVSPIGFQTG